MSSDLICVSSTLAWFTGVVLALSFVCITVLFAALWACRGSMRAMKMMWRKSLGMAARIEANKAAELYKQQQSLRLDAWQKGFDAGLQHDKQHVLPIFSRAVRPVVNGSLKLHSQYDIVD